MSHSHKNCKSQWGTCEEGMLTDYCGHEDCFNPYCSDRGHCPCKCHSGKTCGCGYQWDRMEKVERTTSEV